MKYADITFNDPNRIKRWLQQRRLETAMSLAEGFLQGKKAPVLCDFGAGNGELCKHLASVYRGGEVTCYEPAPQLLAEARENLVGIDVEFTMDSAGLPEGAFDVLFCLEVFEHLPLTRVAEELRLIHGLMKRDSRVIIGVPVEVGVPALYKGLFRMTRRYGAYDAVPKRILASALMRPPSDRPFTEIAPGLPFDHSHMGFDYRELVKVCRERFHLVQSSTSPFKVSGPVLMPEIYLELRPR